MNKELEALRKRAAELEQENAKLKEQLDVVGNIIYIAIQDGSGKLANRIRTVTRISYAEKRYFCTGWVVFKANLDLLTIEKVYPEK